MFPKRYRQSAKEFWADIPPDNDYQPGNRRWPGWGSSWICAVWIPPSSIPYLSRLFHVRIETCVIMRPEGDQFEADAKIVELRIFDSIPQAMAFLDSVLAFNTPEIPADR